MGKSCVAKLVQTHTWPKYSNEFWPKGGPDVLIRTRRPAVLLSTWGSLLRKKCVMVFFFPANDECISTELSFKTWRLFSQQRAKTRAGDSHTAGWDVAMSWGQTNFVMWEKVWGKAAWMLRTAEGCLYDFMMSQFDTVLVAWDDCSKCVKNWG